MKDIKIEINIVLNLEFWALIPAVNINLHSKELEFEFLCFGFYFSAKRV